MSSVQFMGGAECPVSTGLSLTRRDTGPSEALAGTSGSPVSPGSTCRSGHSVGIRHTSHNTGMIFNTNVTLLTYENNKYL